MNLDSNLDIAFYKENILFINLAEDYKLIVFDLNQKYVQ